MLPNSDTLLKRMSDLDFENLKPARKEHIISTLSDNGIDIVAQYLVRPTTKYRYLKGQEFGAKAIEEIERALGREGIARDTVITLEGFQNAVQKGTPALKKFLSTIEKNKQTEHEPYLAIEANPKTGELYIKLSDLAREDFQKKPELIDHFTDDVDDGLKQALKREL